MKKLFAIVAISALTVATAVSAAVTFEPVSGTGFVGKGDVQLAFGWNNAQLQANAASTTFNYDSETVTEVEWTCWRAGSGNSGEQIQVRERTTTTTRTGLVSSQARLRNQFTGFNLLGFGSSTSSSTTDGPQLNSCPNASSGWMLTVPAGDPSLISSTGGLTVTHGGMTYPLS